MAQKRKPPRFCEDIYSDSRAASRRSAQKSAPQRSKATQRPAAKRSGGEIDRYNYVDRDIYSGRKDTPQKGRSSSSARGKKQVKEKHPFIKTLVFLILFVGIGLTVYVGVMMSRLNRTTVDTSSYVQQPSAAPAWDVVSTKRVVNVLLIGVDKGDDGNSHRSDTTMLLSLDTKAKKIRLVSFLRDLYLEIPTVGKNKFNAAYAYGGPALTMQTLENNFRVNIDKYVSVDFESFELLINKMGGIDIDMSAKVAKEENRVMGSNLHEGVNHLDGRLALYYARIRATDSDFGRTGRQRQVMESILTKMKSLNPLELNNVLYDYLPYVETNLADSELLYLASLAPGVGGYAMETMYVPDEKFYVDKTIKGVGMALVPDLEQNSLLLRNFLYPSETTASVSDSDD